jgi:virulence-associated protein VapD
MQKTSLQEFLEQIVLKQVQGSVYLIPAITDIQIKEALKKEKKQLIDFGYSQIQQVDSEIGDLIYKKVPEEIYNETFVPSL